jgi:hypothetical protein
MPPEYTVETNVSRSYSEAEEDGGAVVASMESHARVKL